MASGKGGAVNYDLARKLASSSIGFSAPVSESTAKAVTDAVHLADTWLDGATALPARATRAAAWSPQDWVDNTLETWKRLQRPDGRADLDGVDLGAARRGQGDGRAADGAR